MSSSVAVHVTTLVCGGAGIGQATQRVKTTCAEPTARDSSCVLLCKGDLGLARGGTKKRLDGVGMEELVLYVLWVLPI